MKLLLSKLAFHLSTISTLMLSSICYTCYTPSSTSILSISLEFIYLSICFKRTSVVYGKTFLHSQTQASHADWRHVDACSSVCFLLGQEKPSGTNGPKIWISRTYQKILFILIFVFLKIFSHLFTFKMFCCREDSLITPKGNFVVQKWHLWFLWSNWNFQVTLYPQQFFRISSEIQVISRWWVFQAELSLLSLSFSGWSSPASWWLSRKERKSIHIYQHILKSV